VHAHGVTAALAVVRGALEAQKRARV
jgi:hypothetical protein